MNENDEHFVDANTLAKFLRETRRYVLYLARTGAIRSYPLSGHIRIIRKFRISEVTHDLAGRHRKIRRKQEKNKKVDAKRRQGKENK